MIQTNTRGRRRARTEGQLACPACQTMIAFQLADLLVGKGVFCSGCGGKLSADTETSRPALEAWRRLEDRVSAIDTPGS